MWYDSPFYEVRKTSSVGRKWLPSTVLNIHPIDQMKILNKTRINTVVSSTRLDHPESKEKGIIERKPLHRILTPVLILCQCAGLIPVCGVTGRSPAKLKFQYISLRFLHTTFCAVGATLLGFGSGFQFLEDGVNFYNSIGVAFYICTVAGIILFVNVAKNWPKLMREWALLEIHMKSYPSGFNLQKRIYLVTVIVIIAGALEHLGSLVSTIVDSTRCTSEGNDLQRYFETRFSQLFRRVRFSFPLAVVAQTYNWVATFVWNFVDIFVMIMSMALSELFRRITKRIKTIQTVVNHESVWRNIREDYTKLTVMCRYVNDVISPIILLAFASNLCFICAQLLHSIKPIRHVADGVYFFYSMIYLVVRTIVLTLIAAKVYEESRAPLPLLFAVPAYAYCNEIGRFIQQITAEIVAMTGMNFFSIRKEMVLSVAGTIITYELVLVQFNALNAEDIIKSKNESLIRVYPCAKYMY